ncbi:hypothetical protein V2H21_12620 [Riemerella anatipestifer]|uniref:hypothetical protein n=1 Tax=Riemerella anatipestifer TaxID=34085 RepID=UPI002EB7552A|nr:hypothetical protein [Riemerella anatipestifer]
MRKILLFACLSLFSGVALGQKFQLTSTGFVNADEPSKDYVVVEFPNQNQETIYKKVLVMLNKKYKSAKNVISSVEPETITINAISAKKIRRTGMHSFDNHYNITLSFRDGKVKVDAPKFELTTYDYGKKQEMYLQGGFSLDGSSFGIFKKDGTIKIDKAVEDLNSFANEFIDDIKKADDKDEW